MRRIPSSGTVSRLAWLSGYEYFSPPGPPDLLLLLLVGGFIWFKSCVCLWTHMPRGSNNLSICGNNCCLAKVWSISFVLFVSPLSDCRPNSYPPSLALPASRTATRNRLAGGISAAVRMDEWMSFISLKLECVWSRWIVFVGEVHRSLVVGTSWPVILSFVVLLLLHRNYSLAVV